MHKVVMPGLWARHPERVGIVMDVWTKTEVRQARRTDYGRAGVRLTQGRADRRKGRASREKAGARRKKRES